MRSTLRAAIRPTLALFAVSALLTLTLGLGGCSMDKHAYSSTIHLPKTVALRDTVTDETIWKLDIPVQHELLLDFDRSGEIELAKVRAELPADTMTWKLRTLDSHKKVAKGKVKLPYPNPVSMVVTLRPSPEMPGLTPIPGKSAPVVAEPAPAPAVVEEAPAPAEEPMAEEAATSEAEMMETEPMEAESTEAATVEEVPTEEAPAASPEQQQASDDLLDTLLKP